MFFFFIRRSFYKKVCLLFICSVYQTSWKALEEHTIYFKKRSFLNHLTLGHTDARLDVREVAEDQDLLLQLSVG